MLNLDRLIPVKREGEGDGNFSQVIERESQINRKSCIFH